VLKKYISALQASAFLLLLFVSSSADKLVDTSTGIASMVVGTLIAAVMVAASYRMERGDAIEPDKKITAASGNDTDDGKAKQ